MRSNGLISSPQTNHPLWCSQDLKWHLKRLHWSNWTWGDLFKGCLFNCSIHWGQRLLWLNLKGQFNQNTQKHIFLNTNGGTMDIVLVGAMFSPPPSLNYEEISFLAVGSGESKTCCEQHFGQVFDLLLYFPAEKLHKTQAHCVSSWDWQYKLLSWLS